MELTTGQEVFEPRARLYILCPPHLAILQSNNVQQPLMTDGPVTIHELPSQRSICFYLQVTVILTGKYFVGFMVALTLPSDLPD